MPSCRRARATFIHRRAPRAPRALQSPWEPTRRGSLRRELKAWHVRTVIVGPMANQARMVAFITQVLARDPVQSGGVYVWEGVDQAG